MQMICATCGSVGKPKKVTKGNILIEIFLWLMMILPGLIYSIWRLSSKMTVCRACGAATLVPVDSPVGLRMLREQQKENQDNIVYNKNP